MSADVAAALALTLFAIGVVATFGVRTWVHRRRTGSSGYSGFSGIAGSAGWWGGLLFVAALVLAAVGLILAVVGIVPPASGIWAWVRWAGLVVSVVGFLGVLAAQSGMGASWRIGVNRSERTDLVTDGLFGYVRNPMFTAMSTALAGLSALAPTPLTITAVLCLVTAVQLQVRAVEEPYLLATHGQAYAAYTARVGRFIPNIGRSITTR
ncbi:isoprenylcysteine carboxylmethyltransferase family protein [Cryobacterium cheniae]|uniref:Isoprenylcysteine carboxylmethyltransferase family protein n=1 Tax=Cryobacterium cheniae TaxID=1259262 RepID=A0A4R8XJS1_9MICO|nr:isoprenylcysteine carboxylmethyltransferase family protein [Cryobacterium cheniae]TFC77100.1 isoprenylcysteine carboxylmethyltransferase family protein [Cryobacterium cheniae]